MLMFIACLCPNLVFVHYYAIPILATHFKFHKFFIDINMLDLLSSGMYSVLIIINGPPIEIDLYFINDTPVLVGGTVNAQFTTDRDGLVYYQCHLTHFHDTVGMMACNSNTMRNFSHNIFYWL